jgi:hypothetical protein
MTFDVFGKPVLVSRTGDQWTTYYLGTEGKRRPARDIIVPADTPAAEVEMYLSDLCHEWATARHPKVRRID